jgi:predicted Zn-dependent peptidase
MVARTRLANGLRVVTEKMIGVPSATIGVWVENGSRYERPEQAGISHYLEHLFFKGTERRTAAQIAEEADAVGGVLNAFTGKESTCYYAKVLGEHGEIAEDILSDIFLHSLFDNTEIDRERSVILQEIAQTEDQPDDYVHDLFNLSYWPGHPLSFPVAGRNETVCGLTQADFIGFVGERYRPDRLIIAAAGDITHEHIVEWAEREFGALTGTTPAPNVAPPKGSRNVTHEEKDLEQVHLCLGTPGIPHAAPERYAAYLLNTALGGGMSSRLFQEVREKRGLVYSVYSFLNSYADGGYVGIYAGTSRDSVEEVMTLILRELQKVQREGLPPAELARVKNQLKGNILLGLETSDSRMHRIARNEIYFGKDISPSEVAASIDATTNDEIIALAKSLFDTEALGLTLVGNLKGKTVGEEILSLS